MTYRRRSRGNSKRRSLLRALTLRLLAFFQLFLLLQFLSTFTRRLRALRIGRFGNRSLQRFRPGRCRSGTRLVRRFLRFLRRALLSFFIHSVLIFIALFLVRKFDRRTARSSFLARRLLQVLLLFGLLLLL